MSTSIIESARRAGLRIGELTVIGQHCIGLSEDGGLFKYCGNRWVRLEMSSHVQRHARRLVRYSGHPDTAKSHA